ncbi:hypothetical protein GX586_06625 [bacterium]|nr:hypothetical protein [bacterium]
MHRHAARHGIAAAVALAFCLVAVSARAEHTNIAFDFTGASPGVSAVWTQVSVQDPDLLLVTGLYKYPRLWESGLLGTATNNAYGIAGDYGSTGIRPLEEAIGSNRFVAFEVQAAHPQVFDLRSAIMAYRATSIGYWAPTEFALLTSVEGFSLGAVMGSITNGRTDTPITSSARFALPDEAAYSAVTNLEIRIYAAQGQYYGHAASIDALALIDAKIIPEPALLLPLAFLLARLRRR